MAKLPEHMFSEKVLTEIVGATVRETIRQLRRAGMLRNSTDAAYQEIAERVSRFYRNARTDDEELIAAMARLAAEEPEYFGILPLYYRDKVKIEEIGPIIGCDRSTVLRQKKKLCLRLFQMLQ